MTRGKECNSNSLSEAANSENSLYTPLKSGLHCSHIICTCSNIQVVSEGVSLSMRAFCILIVTLVLSVWEERKVRLYGEHANVHQSHSQNDSGDLRGVAGGDGELGCLCGKAGTSHLCDGSAHSSGCVVNAMAASLSYYYYCDTCVPQRHT